MIEPPRYHRTKYSFEGTPCQKSGEGVGKPAVKLLEDVRSGLLLSTSPSIRNLAKLQEEKMVADEDWRTLR